jgi:hypothetical protein
METPPTRTIRHWTTRPVWSASAASLRLLYSVAGLRRIGVTGVRSFFMDESAVIRGADRQGGPANQDDPPIGPDDYISSGTSASTNSVSSLSDSCHPR